MNTSYGKQLAEERHQFMLIFWSNFIRNGIKGRSRCYNEIMRKMDGTRETPLEPEQSA